MSHLLSPLKIRNLVLKNRLVMPPMCMYSATDGFANDFHLVHYGSRAIGGISAIIQEATAVSPEGRISYGDLGIWKDEHIEKLSETVNFITQHGAIAGIQLAHAGRKASCDLSWNGGKQLKEGINSWNTVSASAIPFFPHDTPPIALSIEGIEKVIADFVAGTKRAIKAGYKIIEIHAAHGYLLHQFFSPLTNKREDEYGGTFENRIRLLLQIVDQIKPLIDNDHSLWVRISATEWATHEGGWDIDESTKLSAILKDKGVDVIDVSSGGNLPHVKIPVGKNYQVPFAERIRKDTGILTSAVGLIDDAHQAEEILEKGEADLIMLGRELLRNPYFPLQAAKELGDDIYWAVQYERAK